MQVTTCHHSSWVFFDIKGLKKRELGQVKVWKCVVFFFGIPVISLGGGFIYFVFSLGFVAK